MSKNKKFEEFKVKLSRLLEINGLTQEDLLPIDIFHLFKHVDPEVIVEDLTWVKVNKIANLKPNVLLMGEATPEELEHFKGIEAKEYNLRGWCYPIIESTDFTKIGDTKYCFTYVPVKTFPNGKTKIKILTFEPGSIERPGRCEAKKCGIGTPHRPCSALNLKKAGAPRRHTRG